VLIIRFVVQACVSHLGAFQYYSITLFTMMGKLTTCTLFRTSTMSYIFSRKRQLSKYNSGEKEKKQKRTYWRKTWYL